MENEQRNRWLVINPSGTAGGGGETFMRRFRFSAYLFGLLDP